MLCDVLWVCKSPTALLEQFCLHSEGHQRNGRLQLTFLFLAGPQTSSTEIMLLFLFRLWIPCAFQILISVYFTSGSSLFFLILALYRLHRLYNETQLMLFIPVGIFLTSCFSSVTLSFVHCFSWLASQGVSFMHKTPFEVKGSSLLQCSSLSKTPEKNGYLPNNWI